MMLREHKKVQSKRHGDKQKEQDGTGSIKNNRYVAVIAYYHENTRLHERITNSRAHSAVKCPLSAPPAADEWLRRWQQTNGRGALDQIKPKTSRKRNIIALHSQEVLLSASPSGMAAGCSRQLFELLLPFEGHRPAWPLTPTTLFLHTAATHSGTAAGLPWPPAEGSTGLEHSSVTSWWGGSDIIPKNKTKKTKKPSHALMQMSQSVCRMNVGCRVRAGLWGRFDCDSERNQATNSTVITGTAPVGERGHAGNRVLCLQAHYSGFV